MGWAQFQLKTIRELYGWANTGKGQQQIKAVTDEAGVFNYRFKTAPEHRFHTMLIPLNALNKMYGALLVSLRRYCSGNDDCRKWRQKHENHNAANPDPMPQPLSLKKHYDKLGSLNQCILLEDVMAKLSGVGDKLGADDRTTMANVSEIDQVATELTAMANATFNTSNGLASRRMRTCFEDEVDRNGKSTGNLVFSIQNHSFTWKYSAEMFGKLYRQNGLEIVNSILNQLNVHFPERQRQNQRLLTSILDPQAFQGYRSADEARGHQRNALKLLLSQFESRSGEMGRQWKRENFSAKQALCEYTGLTLVLYNHRNEFGSDLNQRLIRCWLMIERVHHDMCKNMLRFAKAKLSEAASIIFVERINKKKKVLMTNTRVHYSEKKMDAILRLDYNGPDLNGPAAVLNNFLFEGLCVWDRSKKRKHSSKNLNMMSGSAEKFGL